MKKNISSLFCKKNGLRRLGIISFAVSLAGFSLAGCGSSKNTEIVSGAEADDPVAEVDFEEIAAETDALLEAEFSQEAYERIREYVVISGDTVSDEHLEWTVLAHFADEHTAGILYSMEGMNGFDLTKWNPILLAEPTDSTEKLNTVSYLLKADEETDKNWFFMYIENDEPMSEVSLRIDRFESLNEEDSIPTELSVAISFSHMPSRAGEDHERYQDLTVSLIGIYFRDLTVNEVRDLPDLKPVHDVFVMMRDGRTRGWTTEDFQSKTPAQIEADASQYLCDGDGSAVRIKIVGFLSYDEVDAIEIDDDVIKIK